MSNFLDQAGLEYFWAKIAEKIASTSVTLPKNLVKHSAVQPISATEILNATTLGGYSANYFAKAADLDNVESDLGTNKTDLSTLKSSVTSISSNVATNKTDISNLKSASQTQQTKIASLDSSISNINTQITTLSTDVSELSELPNTVNGLGETVNGFSDQMQTLVTYVNGSIQASGGIMTGPLVAKGDSASPVAQVRNVIFSTTDPTSSDGSDGDIWIKYEM